MKERQNDTETKDQRLKKSFRTTYSIANIGVIICLLSLLLTGLSLKLWQNTGAEWCRYAGLASLGMAFVGILVGFMSQSANQVIQRRARKSGKGPDFFKECQRPSPFSQIVSRFSAGQRVKPTRIIRPRTYVRSNHRAPRFAYARASHSSRGSSDDSGSSGDPDSGNPLERPSLTSQQPSVTISLLSNSIFTNSVPWRASAHGACAGDG